MGRAVTASPSLGTPIKRCRSEVCEGCLCNWSRLCLFIFTIVRRNNLSLLEHFEESEQFPTDRVIGGLVGTCEKLGEFGGEKLRMIAHLAM